jgi:hypothetical protein
MAFVTLAALTALCLLLASTRKYAVFGAGLLLYFYPFTSLGVLALAGIAYYFYRKHQRRNLNVLPRSDT